MYGNLIKILRISNTECVYVFFANKYVDVLKLVLVEMLITSNVTGKTASSFNKNNEYFFVD